MNGKTMQQIGRESSCSLRESFATFAVGQFDECSRLVPEGRSVRIARISGSVPQPRRPIDHNAHRSALIVPYSCPMAKHLQQTLRVARGGIRLDGQDIRHPLVMNAARGDGLRNVHLEIDHVQDNLQHRIDDGASTGRAD